MARGLRRRGKGLEGGRPPWLATGPEHRRLPPRGAHLGGPGGPAQVVTGGQAADASAQHDHGPAHREPGEKGGTEG